MVAEDRLVLSKYLCFHRMFRAKEFDEHLA